MDDSTATMAGHSDLSEDDHSDMQDVSISSSQLIPPPQISYPDKRSLMAGVQAHGRQHGYKVVVKTSSIPTDKKPGRAAKVWLRCDRGGKYRPRNGLTEATRKRRRTSRLIDCPFMVIGNGSSGVWTVEVVEPHHNHGALTDQPHALIPHRLKQGQVPASPYDWPVNASLSPFTTALVIVDMQKDFCEAGGYLDRQACQLYSVQSTISRLQMVLQAFRESGFPIYHTREGNVPPIYCSHSVSHSEGHRPDLSTLSSPERFRSQNHDLGPSVGSEAPKSRLLIRGEPGHETIPELSPIDGEPIIDKPGHGPFAYTDFDLLLRIRGIKNLIVAGVTTDVSVLSTMREANDRGYDCLVLEDEAATRDPSLNPDTVESTESSGFISGTTGKSGDVVTALENFRQMRMRSATKSERADTVSTPHSPYLPDAARQESRSSPLLISENGQTPIPAEHPISPLISQRINPESEVS